MIHFINSEGASTFVVFYAEQALPWMSPPGGEKTHNFEHKQTD